MASIKRRNLVEYEEHWDLPRLAGQVVIRCLVDHAFTLRFSPHEEKVEIRIEGPFKIRESNGEEFLMIPEETLSLGPALRVFQREVVSARAYKYGRLQVLFSDGSSLQVDADQEYEAWGFASGRQRIISTPGGNLAVWG